MERISWAWRPGRQHTEQETCRSSRASRRHAGIVATAGPGRRPRTAACAGRGTADHAARNGAAQARGRRTCRTVPVQQLGRRRMDRAAKAGRQGRG
eukprot:352048-Chlamydomonas_euryale.AAC.7